jgi:hypothetical protein
VPATDGGVVAPLVEYGDPSHLLRQYAHDRKVDLVVLATHGRSALLNVLVGSTAREIVSSAPCDTLIVREPRATGSGAASERARGTSDEHDGRHVDGLRRPRPPYLAWDNDGVREACP